MHLKIHLFLTAAAVALAAAACSPAPTKTEAPKAAETGCAQGAAKLATLGMCPEAAEALLQGASSPAPELPAECRWTVQETVGAEGAEVFLYKAAACGAVVTTLTHQQGAKSQSLVYGASAVFGADAKDRPAVMVLEVDTPDPRATILGQVVLVAETENERRNCEVRPAGIEGWPADALVADLNAAAKTRAKIKDSDGVREACGFYGLNTGETSYWQVKQGNALFFTLGQESPDFDPNSLTVLTKGADGKWAPKTAEPVGERN
jgi:hypothetical protein